MRTVTRRGLALSACLAATAGYVDAIGFLETGGLFVSFMSGNSTQAGIDLLDGGVGVALLALALVASFIAGVTVASTFALRSARDHRAVVVAGSMLLLVVVAMLELLHLAGPWAYSLVAAAMGALNTLYLADGRARVAITYATGTLVSLGLGIAELLTGGRRTAWRRPLLLWSSLAAGAVAGALVHRAGPAPALGIAALVLLVLAVLIPRAGRLRIRRRERRGAGARTPRA